jgi:MFS family permease
MYRVPSLFRRLEQAGTFKMSLFAAIMGFLTYSSMYAFRKPFAAAVFEGELLWGLDLKIWLILAQTLGYMASKFYGIKVISELKKEGRAWLIIGLISISWIALLGFAVVPEPYSVLFFLINGFPLGLIWGIVFHYMEGRQFTEMMGSMLAASFVFSSGFVKSVGVYLMQNWHISEHWMPFATGAVFFPLLLLSVFLLNHIPEPTDQDLQLRSPRAPMSRKDRRDFFKEFRPGIILLIIVYMMLTGLRDLRDNFVIEIWDGLNISVEPELLTQTEIPITLGLLVLMTGLVLVKNNKKAFFINHWIILIGFGLSIFSTLGLQAGFISPFFWMVMVGAGVYMAYIPFNCLLFDRLIATFKRSGNVGFLMYLVDSFGYLGSSLILFSKQLVGWDSIPWLQFYITAIFGFLGLSLVLMAASFIYFQRKLLREERAKPHSVTLINSL